MKTHRHRRRSNIDSQPQQVSHLCGLNNIQDRIIKKDRRNNATLPCIDIGHATKCVRCKSRFLPGSLVYNAGGQIEVRPRILQCWSWNLQVKANDVWIERHCGVDSTRQNLWFDQAHLVGQFNRHIAVDDALTGETLPHQKFKL